MGKVFQKFRGGWITPKGKLINSDFGMHDLTARRLLKEKYPVEYKRMNGYDYKDETHRRDFLVIEGWILLTGNPYNGMGITQHMFIVCLIEDKITPLQHEIINKLKKEGVRFSGYVLIEHLED